MKTKLDYRLELYDRYLKDPVNPELNVWWDGIDKSAQLALSEIYKRNKQANQIESEDADLEEQKLSMVDEILNTPELTPDSFKVKRERMLSPNKIENFGLIKYDEEGQPVPVDDSKILDLLMMPDKQPLNMDLDEMGKWSSDMQEKGKYEKQGYRLYDIDRGAVEGDHRKKPTILDVVRDPYVNQWQGVVNAVSRANKSRERMWLLKDIFENKIGHYPEESMKRLAVLNAEIQGIPSSKAYAMFNDPTVSWDETLRRLKSDPIEILAQGITESLVQFLPAYIYNAFWQSLTTSTAGAIYGGYTGGPAGAVGGGVTGLSYGNITAVGMTSYNMEYTGKILESMEEQGVNISDPNDLEAAFMNEELMSTAKAVAIKKGVPIAIMDMISGRIAGTLMNKFKSKTAGTIAETTTQMAFGGAGEAISQPIAGEEFNLPAIIMEMAAEPGQMAPVGAINMSIKANQNVQQKKFNDTKVGKEILRAREEGVHNKETLDMAEKLAKQNPEIFEEKSILQFTDEVKEMTADQLRGEGKTEEEIAEFFAGEGWEGETDMFVLGSTSVEDTGDILVKLYKGARPDTVIEEFYGNHYRRLTEKSKSLWRTYYAEARANGDKRTSQELFEQEGTQFFINEKLYEDSKVKHLYRRVKNYLNDIYGNAQLKPEIRKLYEDAGFGKVEGVANDVKPDKDESFQLSPKSQPDDLGLKKEISVDRGKRKVINPKTIKLTTLEKKKIQESVKGTTATEKDVKLKIQKYKSEHPPSAGWEKIIVNKITIDDQGKAKIEYKPIPYTFQQYKGKTPKKGTPAYNQLVRKLGKNAVKDLVSLAERARKGDKNAIAIIEQATWYKELKAGMHQQFGGQTNLFGELLGATSPQTAVAGNFQSALEALELFNKGAYKNIIQEYLNYLEQGGNPGKYNGKLPTKKNGKAFGINSKAVLDVLTANWIKVQPGSSPKAKNFALNILGKSDFATIDVWAARAWQRRSGGKRIPPQSETGVKGKYAADGKSITGQFGVGVDAYDYAISQLKKMGLDEYLDTSAVDLQAIDWFLEKENWTANDWTSTEGEGGSFEDQLKYETLPKYKGGGKRERNFDRTQVGSSIQQMDKKPTTEEVEAVRSRLENIINKDDKIRAARYEDSKGLYTYLDDSGSVIPDQERSFDTEITVDRGYVPEDLYSEIIQISKENNQLDTFFSRIAKPDENHPNERPGIEVSFTKPLTEKELSGIVDFIREKGFDGFTLSREQRTEEGLYTGIRLQIIPEIKARYDMGFRELVKDPAKLEEFIGKAEDGLLDLQVELEQRNDVEDSYYYKYITKVVGKENYDSYLQTNTSESNSEIWQGSSLREEVSNAIERYEQSESRSDPDNNQSQEVDSQESFQLSPKNKLDILPETKHSRAWFERKLIDELSRLKYIQKEIGEVSEEEDAYMHMQNMVGRASARVDELREEVFKGKNSIIKRAKDAGHSIENLGEYLYALHAKERNAAMKNKGSKKGSGMTNDQAKEILKKYKKTDISKYADEFIKSTVKKALDIRLEAGLINKAQYKTLKSFYKNYIPLKGTIDNQFTYQVGKGFSVTSSTVMRALGRDSIANNPAVQAIIDLESAVAAAEKNKAMQSFYKLLEENPHESWSLSGRRHKPVYDETGEMSLVPADLADNEVQVFFDGKKKVITIQDKALLKAVKKAGFPAVPRALQVFNAYYRAVRTSYNPEFIITNFERDLQSALIHLTSEQKRGVAWKVVKGINSSMKSIWKNDENYQDYKKHGGKVGWMDYKSVDEKMEEIESSVNRYAKAGQKKEAILYLGQTIGDINEVIENGVRLSTYNTLVAQGMSKAKAANYAKDLTVNFNKKGEWGSWANALYVFSNAGIQGTNRIYRALTNPKSSKKAWTIMSGIAMSGFLQSWKNRQEDEKEWEQFSDYNKDNYFMYMLPNGKAISLKLPYGYNVPFVIGGLTEQLIFGDLQLGEAMSRLMKSGVDAFSPVGGGSMFQVISPSITDPAVQILENKNFFGGPIAKESKYEEVKRSKRHFKSVRSTTKDVTDWLSKITGGSEKRAGKIEINPEHVDHLIDEATGGVGKFFANTLTTGKSFISESQFPPYKNIPVVRQFIKEKSDYQARGVVYEMLAKSSYKKFNKEMQDRFYRQLEYAKKSGQITAKQRRSMKTKFRRNQRKL